MSKIICVSHSYLFSFGTSSTLPQIVTVVFLVAAIDNNTHYKLLTVTTVQTGFDQTISSVDNQQRVGQTESNHSNEIVEIVQWKLVFY